MNAGKRRGTGRKRDHEFGGGCDRGTRHPDCKELDATLHLCHCSTADSVRMIKDAKEAGLKVTGEVCPHHFILTDEDIPENNGIWKMNPPLRSKADVEALRQGLKDGVMDVISTDHAPHMMSEKDKPMEQAAFGIVGLETSACLTYTELVEKECSQ